MSRTGLVDERSVAISTTNTLPIGIGSGMVFIDETSTASITYIGKARRATTTSDANWQIMVIDETTDTVKINLFPNGDDSPNYVWDDRTTYTYS